MRGASKIERSTFVCRQHGRNYIWIDTCCIDKSSSAELSEAINSMYKWYAKSEVCFAYLDDVNCSEGMEAIRKSRWFTRGWTLQELIAPLYIEFLDQRWQPVGKKSDLSALLSEITTVPENVLEEPLVLKFCSVARRMSWAAHRETTREEDIAYCLLGIFDVNMPLLYGEGARAFTRLQEEILKETDDQSLFAWGSQSYAYLKTHTGVLALHPLDFAMSKNIIPFPSKPRRQPYSMTNKGLQIELPILEVIDDEEHGSYCIALLDCHYEDDFSHIIALSLVDTEKSFEFLRSHIKPVITYPIERMKDLEVGTIVISKHPSTMGETKVFRKCLVRVKCTEPRVYTMEQIGGHNTKWNPEAMVLNMTFAIPDGVLQYASSTIMFTDIEHGNSSFAIFIAIRTGPFFFSPWEKKTFDLLSKPRDVTLDEWSKSLKAGEIDWDRRRKKEVQLIFLPDNEGLEGPLTIKASIKKEEILNQWIDVLIIEISQDVPQVAGKSTKWESVKRLSY